MVARRPAGGVQRARIGAKVDPFHIYVRTGAADYAAPVDQRQRQRRQPRLVARRQPLAFLRLADGRAQYMRRSGGRRRRNARWRSSRPRATNRSRCRRLSWTGDGKSLIVVDTQPDAAGARGCARSMAAR